MAMPSSGAKAVADSQAQSNLAESERGGGMETTGLKVIANKAFVLRDEVWTDTIYDPHKMETIQVPFGSPAYFSLLGDHPHWGKYFAIGDRVIAVLDGVAYQVGPGDATTPTTPSSPAQSPDFWERFWFWWRIPPR